MQFSLAGFRVSVSPLFWLTAVWFGFARYGDGDLRWGIALWVPIMFLAVLVHEMAHAVAFRRYGVPSEIQLIALGGVTIPLAQRRLKPGQAFIVSFAGPLVGIVIGGAAIALQSFVPLPPSLPLRIALEAIIWTNLGWAIFNLVPIVGLDGGNMMMAVFEKLGGGRGVRLAYVVSIFIAGAIATYFMSHGQFLTAVLVGYFGWQNYLRWRLAGQWGDRVQPIRPAAPAASADGPKRGEAIDVRPIDQDLVRAWEALEKGNPLTVRMIAEPLVARAHTDDERFQVAHLVAWGRLLSGDTRAAELAIERLMPAGRRPDALLEGSLLLERQKYGPASDALAEALVGRSDDFVAVRLSRAVAESGRIDALVSHLANATRAEDIGVRPFQVVVAELMRHKRWTEATILGEALFRRFGVASDAFNVACSLGRAGRGEEALGWLDEALQKGLPDPTLLLTDADLAAVRELPGFEAIRERVDAKLSG